MQRVAQCALAFLTVMSLGLGAAQAQRADMTGFDDEEALRRQNLVRQWYLQIQPLGQREKVSSLKVLDDLLMVQTDKGQIHSLDAETGRVHWNVVIGEGNSETYPPAITPKFVYVVSADTLAALDRETGGIVWTRELPGLATSGPGANDDYVYVQLSDHRIYAVAVKDEFQRKYTARPVAWYLQADGALENPPIVLKDRLALMTSAGTLYALPLDSRKLFYRFFTRSRNSAPLATLGSLLYVATTDYDLFAIDLKTGRLKWRFPSGFPIHSKPIPFVDDVYVTPTGAGLYALSNENGRAQWYNPHAKRLIAVSQSHVYAADRINRFMILSRKEGNELASWLAPAFKISTDNQFTDRIYMSTEDGLVVCLRETENVKPHSHPQLEAPVIEEPSEMPESGKSKSDEKKPSRGFFDDIDDAKDKPALRKGALAGKTGAAKQPSAETKPKPAAGFFKGLFENLGKPAEKKEPAKKQ